MRTTLILGLAVLAAACGRIGTVSVKNDCLGAWFQVSALMGAGHVKTQKLNEGERMFIPLKGIASQRNTIVIMIDGYRHGDNLSLGSVDRPYDIGPANSGELLAPQNNYSWGVSEVYPRGCPSETNRGDWTMSGTNWNFQPIIFNH